MNNQQHENPLTVFLRKLEDESRSWERDGLISIELREMILRRYEKTPEPIAETPTTHEFPLYIRVVLILAVLLVGLAVFLLVSFNWEQMTEAVKLSIVGTGLAAAHLGGIMLRKAGQKGWADGVFFLAGIMFGVGIWQIGQVFHLPADFPLGMLLWGLGVMLFAIVLGSTPLHFLAVAIFGGWIFVALGEALDSNHFPLYGLIPITTPTLPIIAALGIGAGLLRRERHAPALYSFLLLFWWILQGLCCGLGPYLTFHIAAMGLICIAISARFRSRGMAHAALGSLGILVILGGLLMPSFLFYWNGLLYRMSLNILSFWPFFVPTLDLVVLVGLFVLNNLNSRFFKRIFDTGFIIGFTIALFALWFGGYSFTMYVNPDGEHTYFPQSDAPAFVGILLVNALILALTIWLIQVGLKTNRGGWFWSGVVFFLLWAVIRYIDLFSGIGGMLGAAAIFLFCGLFMLGIVYLWTRRNRENTVQEMELEPNKILTVDWIEPIRNKISFLWQSERNVLIGALLIALLQFGVLGAMIANEMRPHLSGTTIQVTTIPVDPRDLFRGDYVILRYEFSDPGMLLGKSDFFHIEEDQTVFIPMEQKGDLWEPGRISKRRPKEGVFLRGTIKPYASEIVYGIESYFVQEGKGKEIEEAMRTDPESVIVELNVATDGKASIKTLHVRPSINDETRDQ